LFSRTAMSSSLPLILLVVLASSTVAGARCQVSGVSYNYPSQVMPGQQIQVDTTVAGSCVSNGEDYYAVRVDLVDLRSGYIISSSDTPIGHNATEFNVTAVNPLNSPTVNMTWPLQIHVYVIRAGGTNGMYLLDYQTISNATIQVGATATPEFRFDPIVTIASTLGFAIMILHRRRSSEKR